MILFFSCPNFFGGNTDNVSIAIPEFYVSDNMTKTTTVDEEVLELYYTKAEIPEDKKEKYTELNYIDIRPLLYTGMTNSSQTLTESVRISPSGEDTLISKDSVSDDIWEVYLDSKENWKFEADTNYKVSFEARIGNADAEYSTVIVELKDSRRTCRGANLILENLTDEFDNFSFETGCYNKDWDGHLQIALGFFQGDFYIKNLKIEKTDNNSLVISNHLGGQSDDVTIEKIKDGVTFIFETDEMEEGNLNNTSYPAIGGFAVEDNKLYEVTFNASADEKNVTLKTGVYPIDYQYSHSEITTTIGTKPIPIKMYVPGAIISSEEYRFAYIEVNTPAKNSITITDVKVKEISKTPQDVDIIVKINDKYGELTEEAPYVITQLPSSQCFEFDIAFSKINSTQIDFTDFCRICEFSKDVPESLNVSNTLENSEVVRTFTNNASEEKYYKISLDSNWKIIFEETDFKVIDGSGQTPPEDQNPSETPDEGEQGSQNSPQDDGDDGDGTSSEGTGDGNSTDSGNSDTNGEEGSSGSSPDNNDSGDGNQTDGGNDDENQTNGDTGDAGNSSGTGDDTSGESLDAGTTGTAP